MRVLSAICWVLGGFNFLVGTALALIAVCSHNPEKFMLSMGMLFTTYAVMQFIEYREN
jgi:hypothetical protein